jgi:hypothetical protein
VSAVSEFERFIDGRGGCDYDPAIEVVGAPFPRRAGCEARSQTSHASLGCSRRTRAGQARRTGIRS